MDFISFYADYEFFTNPGDVIAWILVLTDEC